MSAALERAIERVYSAFQAPPPARIDACPCCRDPRGYRPLHAKPLRELTSSDLGSYTFSALLTAGSEADVRYLLPRVLELAVLEPDGFPDIEIRLAKLALMNWRAWPAQEQDVLELFVREWLDALLETKEPNVRTMDALVCGAAIAGLDLDWMLLRISQSPRIAQALFDDNSGSFLKHGAPSNAFWPQTGLAREAFIHWLENMAGS